MITAADYEDYARSIWGMSVLEVEIWNTVRLEQAVMQGDEAMAGFLLALANDPRYAGYFSKRKEDYQNLPFVAMDAGQFRMAERLKAAGFSLRCLLLKDQAGCDIEASALQEAMCKGRLDIVKFLLENDSEAVDLRTPDGERGVQRLLAIVAKCSFNNQVKTDMLALLFSHIDRREFACLTNESKNNFLHRLALASHWLQFTSVQVDQILKGFPVETMFVNRQNRDGNTPLHLAIRGGYFSLIECIVKTGIADFSVRNRAGETVFDLAGRMHEQSRNRILFLLDNGQLPDRNASFPFWQGRNAQMTGSFLRSLHISNR